MTSMTNVAMILCIVAFLPMYILLNKWWSMSICLLIFILLWWHGHFFAIGNLYQVPVWNCLNQKYLRMLLEMKMKDDISERCVAFSPMLKFWYDRAWVSRIPIGQTNYFEIRIQPGNPSKEEICKVIGNSSNRKSQLLNFTLQLLVLHLLILVFP